MNVIVDAISIKLWNEPPIEIKVVLPVSIFLLTFDTRTFPFLLAAPLFYYSSVVGDSSSSRVANRCDGRNEERANN
jgi:hypothetical protein